MNLLIRADANVSIGTGHVMRCLALAEAWQDAGGRAVFAMAQGTHAVEQRLRAEQCEIVTFESQAGSAEDAAKTSELAREVGAKWVVVDGYHFGADYQSLLKQGGTRVLFVDDNGHAGSYCADLILNQNVHAHEGFYQHRTPQTQMLLGCRYSMLRREFATWRGWRREIPDVARRLLVTVGGSDPDNLTLPILQAIPAEQCWETTVIVGGSNPHLLELRTWIANQEADFHLQADVVDMPRRMAESDVAIASAGTTSWEMCFLGLPALLIVAAENQKEVAEGLDRRGASTNLGWGAGLNRTLLGERLAKLQKARDVRKSMSDAGRRVVDGRGAERVVRALRTAVLSLRGADPSDRRRLWEWANDRAVREAAFSPDPISWEDHCRWFEGKLRDPRTHIYIALDAWDAPVGQIRFDQTTCGEADIDVSVDRQFRGMGIARKLIEGGSRNVFERGDVTQLHAYVRPENRASAHAFERAGFKMIGTEKIRGNPAVHYTLRKL